MTALTQDRQTPQRVGDIFQGGMAASVTIYAGAIVMRNASGYLTKGQAATALVGVGRAEERAINGTSAGGTSITYRKGCFRFGNSTSTDLITIADIGKPCFVVDDQTVAKTDGSAARSIAGFVADVDANGVWVDFDETAVRSYLAGITLPSGT
jgi:hypothetical protein